VVGACALMTGMESKMKTILSVCCATLFVLSLQVLPGALVTAQAADSEEVIVDGPYTISQVQEPWLGLTMGELKISVSRRVNFSDLDFSKQADLDELRDRLKTAAMDSCVELERRFPSMIYSSDRTRKQCVREANRAGWDQAMTNLQTKAMAQRGAVASIIPPQAR